MDEILKQLVQKDIDLVNQWREIMHGDIQRIKHAVDEQTVEIINNMINNDEKQIEYYQERIDLVKKAISLASEKGRADGEPIGYAKAIKVVLAIIPTIKEQIGTWEFETGWKAAIKEVNKKITALQSPSKIENALTPTIKDEKPESIKDNGSEKSPSLETDTTHKNGAKK